MIARVVRSRVLRPHFFTDLKRDGANFCFSFSLLCSCMASCENSTVAVKMRPAN